MGVVAGSVLRVRVEDGALVYAVYPELPFPRFWDDYLRLEFDLEGMYVDLAGVDPTLDYAFARWRGLRVLRQDPTETICSFLCTTANSIPRITRAIEGMSRLFGESLATIDGSDYYSFPGLEALTTAAAPQLERECNLGYRAHNLVRAVEEIRARPPGWADSLRSRPYAEAKAELTGVRGVGPKIADCVCIFSLDKDEAVPVDTHVRQIAVELYMPELKARSLTANVYTKVGDYFRERFGARAGWAQQYLFYWHLVRHREPPVL